MQVLFPQQAPVSPSGGYPAALLTGTLMVENNCLRVRATYDNTNWLPVWPPEFTLIDDNGTLTIRDGEQQIVARIGDIVRLGGGAIPDDENSWLNTEMLRQKPPQACAGPYWLAAPEVTVVPQ